MAEHLYVCVYLRISTAARTVGVDSDAVPGSLEVDASAGDGTNTLGTVDCVICMTEVVVVDRDYMVTPCLHLFHEECLRHWMDVKMECPTCRALLPSP